MNCYNCGIELEEKTREHIPAKSLYEGYSDEYKRNIIVVDACFECNNQYSKIDPEIRDVIGFTNDDNIMQKRLTEKSIKSMKRKKDFDRMRIETGKLCRTFNYNDLKNLHLKNLKGVFYHDFKTPLPAEFILEVIAEGDEDDKKKMEIKRMFKEYLGQKEWKISGHEDIFKYRYVMINLERESKDYDFISEVDSIEDCELIVCEFFYHNKLNPLIFATKKNFRQNLK